MERHSVHQAVGHAKVKDSAVDRCVVVPQDQRIGLPVPAALELRSGLVGKQEVQDGSAFALRHSHNFTRHEFRDEQHLSP